MWQVNNANFSFLGEQIYLTKLLNRDSNVIKMLSGTDIFSAVKIKVLRIS